MESIAVAVTPCRDHPEVAATGACTRCGRLLCDVCAFELGGRRFCPDCATAGPSADERSRVVSGGLLSLGLGVVGFAIVAVLVGAGASGAKVDGPLATLLGIAMLAAGLGGLAAGLSSREGARRTGSLLPMIGIVANGLLVALILVFVFVSMSR